jgi:hypothetical protein
MLRDAADTLADIDQQARVLCGSCGPEAALAPPEALSSATAAATVNNLLVRPVSQAQVDAKAVEAARDAALKAGASVAEATAGTIPQDHEAPGAADGSATAEGPPPVNSTITPEGGLVPALPAGGGGAVKDLVTGVTGTVEDVTGTGTGTGTNPASPVDKIVDGLTDTLDKTTQGLVPGEQD